jgi:hypothetical protein
LKETYTFLNRDLTEVTRDNLEIVELPFTYKRQPVLTVSDGFAGGNKVLNGPLYEHLVNDIIQVSIGGASNISYNAYKSKIKSELPRGSLESYDISYTYDICGAGFANDFTDTITGIQTSKVKFVPYKADDIEFIYIDVSNQTSSNAIEDAVEQIFRDVSNGTSLDSYNFTNSEFNLTITDQSSNLAFVMVPIYYEPNTNNYDVSMMTSVFLNTDFSAATLDASSIVNKRHPPSSTTSYATASINNIDISSGDSSYNAPYLVIDINGPMTFDGTISVTNVADGTDYGDADIAKASGFTYTKQLIINSDPSSNLLIFNDVSLNPSAFDFSGVYDNNNSGSIVLPTLYDMFDSSGSDISYSDDVDGRYTFADDYEEIFEEAIVNSITVRYYTDTALTSISSETATINKPFNEVADTRMSAFNFGGNYTEDSEGMQYILRTLSFKVNMTVSNSTGLTETADITFNKYGSETIVDSSSVVETNQVLYGGSYPNLSLDTTKHFITNANHNDIATDLTDLSNTYITNVTITSYDADFSNTITQTSPVNKSLYEAQDKSLSSLVDLSFTDMSNIDLLRIKQIDISAQVFTHSDSIKHINIKFTDFDLSNVYYQAALTTGEHLSLGVLSYNRNFVGLTSGTGLNKTLFGLNTVDSSYNNGVALFEKLHTNNSGSQMRLIDDYYRVFDLNFDISAGDASTNIVFNYMGLWNGSSVDTETGATVPTAGLTLTYVDMNGTSQEVSASNEDFDISAGDTLDLVYNTDMSFTIVMDNYTIGKYPDEHNTRPTSVDISYTFAISFTYESMDNVSATVDISAKETLEYYENYDVSALPNGHISYDISTAFSNTDMSGYDVSFVLENTETGTSNSGVLRTASNNLDLVVGFNGDLSGSLDNSYNRFSTKLTFADQRITYSGVSAWTNNSAIFSGYDTSATHVHLTNVNQAPAPIMVSDAVSEKSIRFDTTNDNILQDNFLDVLLEKVTITIFDGELDNVGTDVVYYLDNSATDFSQDKLTNREIFVKSIKFYYDLSFDASNSSGDNTNTALGHAGDLFDTAQITQGLSNIDYILTATENGATLFRYDSVNDTSSNVYNEVTRTFDWSKLLSSGNASVKTVFDSLITQADITDISLTQFHNKLIRAQVELHADISAQQVDISNHVANTTRSIFESETGPATVDSIYDISGTTIIADASTNRITTAYKVLSSTTSTDETNPVLFIKDGSGTSFTLPQESSGINIEFGSNTIQVTLDENFTSTTTLDQITDENGFSLVNVFDTTGVRSINDICNNGLSSVAKFLDLSESDVKHLYFTGKKVDGTKVIITNTGTAYQGDEANAFNAIASLGLKQSGSTYVTPKFVAWQIVPELDESRALFTHVYDNIRDNTNYKNMPYENASSTEVSYGNWYSDSTGLSLETVTQHPNEDISIIDITALNISNETNTTTTDSSQVTVTNYDTTTNLGGKTVGFGIDNLLKSVILDRNRPGKYKFLIYTREGSSFDSSLAATVYNEFNLSSSTDISYEGFVPAQQPTTSSNETSNTASQTTVTSFNIIVRTKDHNLVSVNTYPSVSHSEISMNSITDGTLDTTFIDTLTTNNISNTLVSLSTANTTTLGDDAINFSYYNRFTLHYEGKLLNIYDDYYNVYVSDRKATSRSVDISGDISFNLLAGINNGALSLNELLTHIHNNNVSLNISEGPLDISLSWRLTHDISFISGKLHDDNLTLTNDRISTGLNQVDLIDLSAGGTDPSGIVADGNNALFVLPDTEYTGTIHLSFTDTEAPQLILRNTTSQQQAYDFTHTTTNIFVDDLSTNIGTVNNPNFVLTDVYTDSSLVATMSDNHLAGIPSDSSENIVIITNVTRLNKNTYALDNLYNISRSFDLQITASDASAQHLLIRESLDNCGNGIDISTGRVPILRSGSLEKLEIDANLVDLSHVVIVEYVGYGAQGTTFIRSEPKFLVIDASRNDDGVVGEVSPNQMTNGDTMVFYDDQGETANVDSTVETTTTNRFGIFFN